YKDEYTSANDVKIDPQNPDVVYAALWQQQQSYIEGGGFGGVEGSNTGGIFKSTDGGTNWTQLTTGLPALLEANLAISPSDPKTIYAMVAVAPNPNAGGGRGGGAAGALAIYKTVDGGDHWFLAVKGPNGTGTAQPDQRPLGRIGGGDLATLTV